MMEGTLMAALRATHQRLVRCHFERRAERPLRQRFRSASGVTAIEYALIAALIAIVIVAAVGLAGDALVAFFERVADWLVWVTERVIGGSDAPPPGTT